MTLERIDRFSRDRDRLMASRAFRRLAGKTQVVALAADPLVRTRLTHTLEVASIAREIGRGLGLCDPLIEAIALGHDIGHPAFGHAGERALASIAPGGFHHAAHGVRVATVLEPELQISAPVLDGMLKHSKGRAGAAFARRGGGLVSLGPEAFVVRAADLFAYASHDLDDAYRLGALGRADLPERARSLLGTEPDRLRTVLVSRTIAASLRHGDIALDSEADGALAELRQFLYERLYEGPRLAQQTSFVRSLIASLWECAAERPLAFARALGALRLGLPDDTAKWDVSFVDAVAAMTDRQAVDLARALRIPRKVFAMSHRYGRVA